MRKILSLLIALIICLACALPCFAVIAEKEDEGIRVTVSKKGGAPVYEYKDGNDSEGNFTVYYTPTDKRVPVNTQFTVDWETAFVTDDDGSRFIEGEYKGEWIYLNPSDVSLDLTPVIPPEDKAGRTRHLTVFDDDVKLYEGPSKLYKAVKDLPEGTRIEAVQYDFGNMSTWYYAKAGKVSGWLNFTETPEDVDFICDISYKEDIPSPTGRIITINTLDLYDEPDSAFDSDPVASVPAGRELTFSNYFMWDFEEGSSLFALIDYNGTRGWAMINNDDGESDAMYQVDGYMMINEPDEIFEDDNLRPGKDTGIYIEPHTIVRFDYRYNEPADTDSDNWFRPYTAWYRINLGSGNYWISFGSEGYTHPAVYEGRSYTVADGLSLKLYNEPDKKTEKAGTVSSGEAFTLLFTDDQNDYAVSFYDSSKVWRYVEYKGERYWTLFDWGDVEPNYAGIPEITLTADKNAGKSRTEPETEFSLNPFKDGKFKLPFNIFGSRELGDDLGEELGELGDEIGEAAEKAAGKADSLENAQASARSRAKKSLKKELVRAVAVTVIAAVGITLSKKKEEENG